MTKFTRDAIRASFSRLLNERPLNEITVKDIVEDCGINRNTFYYHYKDLTALLDEIIKEETDRVIKKYSSLSSIVECYDALIDFASENKRAIMHIYRSVSRDIFEYYLMELSKYFIKSYAALVFKDVKVSANDLEVIVNYYKCSCFGLVIDWLNGGMSDEYAQTVRRIFKYKESSILEIVANLEPKN